ncbi:LuxR C-terminal-related transcriptional regulator [Terrabacter sp. MAHUQ-38]|uniref:ATP-binding protein n=1 Tax=unclassified Terrabacter TaxID=2630222 RepID=UPI00165D4CCF|nr:LuxR family transcriptional regulator [Terrabacter sp. MAHUQ-38]
MFQDGVCFVPLGAVGDADDVPDQIAGALGLYGRSTQSGTIAIVEYLRKRAPLLVLDNCEHVVDVVAVLADTVLRSCPGARILATSREPLRIDGEVVHAVSPLTCPAQEEPGEGGLQEFEAVQLLLDRARASVPGFALSEDNRAAVRAICHKLEGIPLAIELAAARLPTLSAAELDQALTDKWELLSRGRRTAPHRHSTMAACIEWTFDLCTPAERKLWAKASVFVDGFDLDAAAATCSDPDDEEPVAETLASLVDKSVLATTRGPTTTRFRMLPPIRHRGLAELARMGGVDEQRRRHRDFFVAMVGEAHDEWLSDRQLVWIDRVGRELGNIAEAMDSCTAEPAAVDAGLACCANLLEYVVVHGLIRQARRWCDKLLASGDGDPRSRALALRSACWWAALQGDIESATPLLEEGRTLASGLGHETQVLLTQAAGLVAMYAGEVDAAEHLFDDAIRGLSASGNAAEVAHCWMLRAILSIVRDDVEQALASHSACLAITDPVGEMWLRSWSMWAAGLAHWERGERHSAERLLKESLRLEQLMHERLGIGATLQALAWVDASKDPERAAVLMGAAQNEWDRIETSIQALPGLDVRHASAKATARDVLGEEAFERAWSQGRSLDQPRAIAFGLEQTRGRRAVTPAVATAHDVLTRREWQIAELIRDGLTNKEIADRLVISRRTAEAHVEHILTKLGFTSRAQVAAWVAEQSSPDEG